MWEVDMAAAWVRNLAFARLWFIAEPTSPDDIGERRVIREQRGVKRQTRSVRYCVMAHHCAPYWATLVLTES